MSDHVRLEPVAGTFRATAGDAVLAESRRAVIVHEGNLPPRYYVPREDIRADVVDGEGSGVCPWKGKWRHVGVRAPGGATIPNAAWTYFETTPVCEPVRDFLAFYPDKVKLEVC